MNSKMIFLAALSFTFGVMVGAFSAYQDLSQKFETRFQEEMASVRKVQARKEQEAAETTTAVIHDIPEEESAHDPERPYVISPDEFGEFDDYETISLTYYQDGTVTDDNDLALDDVDDIIGNESLSHFGEYEDDSVFVRNDKLRCDYEILYDRRPYSDILRSKPYLREGV